MSETNSQAVWRRVAVQQLESLQRAGVQQLGRSKGPLEFSGADLETSQTHEEPALTQPSGAAAKQAAGQSADPESALSIVRAEVAGCTACDELASTRTQTVFGVGNPRARLCFVGEAPGADEDRQGEPFVGRAGKLLTDIIEKGMKLKRSDIYILNVLKCRPPGNRNPLPTEVVNCRGFLDRQLEIIQPEFLCCLGAVAAQTLLSTDTPIGKLRGSFHDYRGIKVLCTYHPAYLLRNPPAKKHTWEDIKILMQAMGTEVE
jgi:DNA polymerase